jgi:hypothetical protein
MAKRKKVVKPKKKPTGYFIRRVSLIEGDTTQYFHDEGQRVWFGKATWARWVLRQFQPEQKAKIVRGPVLEGDKSYQEWLAYMLPDGTGVEEYLAAIEQAAREEKAGGPKRRDIRAVNRYLRRRYA